VNPRALLSLVAAAALLVGCAAPAAPGAMMPPAATVPAPHQFPYTVSVATRGGAATDPMLSTNVSDADLRAAVESAIRDSRVFREVVSEGADYRLSVTVVQLTKPFVGFDFTVTMETGWTLVRAQDQQVLLRKVVSGTHTATMSESFIGAKRLELAVEGAARRNIEQGISALAALDL